MDLFTRRTCMPPLVCTDKLCFKANASLTRLHCVAPVSTMNLILERQLEPGSSTIEPRKFRVRAEVELFESGMEGLG